MVELVRRSDASAEAASSVLEDTLLPSCEDAVPHDPANGGGGVGEVFPQDCHSDAAVATRGDRIPVLVAPCGVDDTPLLLDDDEDAAVAEEDRDA